ncbi:TRAP transporter large permease [Acuticoccus kandeliae]|uniref:TRAP transporter large permease n=1 Tax=Acuticoccus kandeliae TaxID=2073160 RepID=UPI000D3E51A2|nr:TRAP transporter large permease [Acuticoccus kandeliae]
MLPWYTYLSIGGGLAFGLFLLGTPIFLSFLVVIIIGIAAIIGPAGFSMFVNSLYEATTTTSLASIPLFILMGELLFRSGTMDVLFTSVDKLVGRVKGRQYVLVIVLSAVFGALSGSAMAVAAMLGRAAVPGMLKRGYDVNLSAGSILAGASLAPIIPPSILAIIVGTIADVSIAKLLVAGVVPGLLLAALFLGYVFIVVGIDPSRSPPSAGEVTEVSGREKVMAVVRCLPFLIVIFMVMGLIMLGVATPSESAATGVIGALVTAAIYRNLSWKMIVESLAAAASIACTILVIMAMSKMLTQLLAFTGSTRALVDVIAGLGLDALPMLIVMLVVPFILCMFVDQIAIMLILIPLFEPIMKSFGFDPVWFWLLFLINMTLGGITPPLGYTLFAFQSVTPQISLQQVFRAVWPFVALFILGMALMVAFPPIVTFIPNLL